MALLATRIQVYDGASPENNAIWRDLLQRAGELGNPYAIVTLVTGEFDQFPDLAMPPGKERDDLIGPAIAQLRALSQAGNADATTALFQLARPDPNNDEALKFLPQSYESACKYLEEAMAGGSIFAMIWMGYLTPPHICAFKGDAWLNYWRDIYLAELERRANAGNSTAMRTLFELNTNTDMPGAVAWLNSAYAAGNRFAAYDLTEFVLVQDGGQFTDYRRAGRILADRVATGDTYWAGNVGGYLARANDASPPPGISQVVTGLQEGLTQLGYYSGPIDGRYGPGTEQAARAAYNTRPALGDDF
jgi:hypothetical protein